MNGSLQSSNYQLPSAHLASLLQQADAGGHSATFQNLQKSAALQQLAYQSSLYATPPAAPVHLSPPSQHPFPDANNIAAAATAAALLASSHAANRMRAAGGHPHADPPALAASPQHQQALLERLVDASQLQSHIQAAAAAAALQSAQAQTLLQAHALNAHKAQAMYQAAAAAVAACGAHPSLADFAPPVSTAPSPFVAAAQPHTLGSSPPVWPPRTPPNAPSQPLVDPQAAALSSLLSNLLPPQDPLPHPNAPTTPGLPPFLASHLAQANLAATAAAAAANPALARALSLPAAFSSQDSLARAAAVSQAAFAAAAQAAPTAHHVPQRATWHAQRPLPSATSAPPPRNSLDVRPSSHAAGHLLHLHHVGITHAGSSTRAVAPPSSGPKPPGTPPLGHPPAAPAAAGGNPPLPPRGGSPQPKADGTSSSGPSAAAVASLAKLITQAGIVAGRKKATPGVNTGAEGGEDSAVKEEFKQQILVQVGEKLAQAGYTVDEAVKAGLLGGMYVGEVRILCAAHKAECERLAAGGSIPPDTPDSASAAAPATPPAVAASAAAASPEAGDQQPDSTEGHKASSGAEAATGTRLESGKPVAASSPFGAAAAAGLRAEGGEDWGAVGTGAGALQGGRAHSAPAAQMFDAFSYSFFGSGGGHGAAGASEDMLLEELEEGEGEGAEVQAEGLVGGWSAPERQLAREAPAAEADGPALEQQMSVLAV